MEFGTGTLQSIQNGVIVGLAASFLTLDLGGDILAPGAFDTAIAGFLASGFVTLGHDWDRLPIGMPLAAVESQRGLMILARLHETHMTEELKTVITDRLAGGLRVGLSIGFSAALGAVQAFRSGAELLQKWPQLGLQGKPEPETLNKWDRPCRVIRRVETLFEVSLVSVPMNPHARLLGAAPIAPAPCPL